MIKRLQIRVLPENAENEKTLLPFLALQTGWKNEAITGYKIIKKSIDARSRIIWVNLVVEVYSNQAVPIKIPQPFEFKTLPENAKTVLVIGSGPAGIFAALQLIQYGIRPIVLERGKPVKERRRDLALLNREGIIHPESNYCFGEGGAGTYSDGKLYTRSNKRGNIQKILDLFVQFGADEKIQYEAHPHIGTNKLPQIITAMRNAIENCGGKILFNRKMADCTIEKNRIKSIKTADGEEFSAGAYILATGHSARDIFQLFYSKKIQMEAKPFALGVRVEHPQALIDAAQYKCEKRNQWLPPASYSLVEQVQGKAVFSFCMCPGGIIAPASTGNNELVVNGWSPSKRNNPYANSGMVVEVNPADLRSMNFFFTETENESLAGSPLSMMYFQKKVEEKAFWAGGGKFVAPAQRLVDFTENKTSNSLPACSYLPGIRSVNLNEVLPDFIGTRLAIAFKSFGKKLKSYYTNEAVLVATESRTSTPVKIPRDPELLTHPQLTNLYPCGEGAGYAGGIVSAAMDGERCADQIFKQFGN
jgi:uncharacterized FAD-dependent dehydrogenase